ncbi:hypothetical protein [Ferrimonas balearica]|uniref:hypothetical protein n=1 Tax=Ferrimonas balearica TaxID=44012 RepID=UPI001C9998A3|nr:hypothetical protein [Ferrimonas balearica]MBY5921017.1 hypothetical protein [Ferrimonas balearica]MBY5996298.1 hypothetical protein [Ferrimonas balearica]
MVKLITFFCSILFTFSCLSEEVFDEVSVIELHNFPERYMDKVIAIEGYFLFQDGKTYVYPTKDAALVDFRAHKKLVLLHRNEVEQYKPCMNAYAVLVARFGHVTDIFGEMELLYEPKRMISYHINSDLVTTLGCSSD